MPGRRPSCGCLAARSWRSRESGFDPACAEQARSRMGGIAMSRLGRENRHARESITPRLEELESRNLLSGAGFDAGGTQAVASGILRSTEALTDFVTGEYVRFLRRSPDQAGLQDWV